VGFYVILLKIVQTSSFPSSVGKKHFLCGTQLSLPFLPSFKIVPNKGKNVNPTTFYPSSIFPTTFTQNKQALKVCLVYKRGCEERDM